MTLKNFIVLQAAAASFLLAAPPIIVKDPAKT